MAEQGRSIFNKRATEKLRNPDDLDKYVRVTSVSIWVVLVAIVALLAGIFAWGFFGTISTSVNTSATRIDDSVICFLTDDEEKIVHEGDEAMVGDFPMKVSYVSQTPMSRDECSKVLDNDYLLKTLVKEDWAYMVVFSSDKTPDFEYLVPINASITTERVAPISLILGK